MKTPRVHLVSKPPEAAVAPDPKGRVDLLVLALAETAVARFVQPYVPEGVGLDVWNQFAKPILQAKIDELGIPDHPVDAIEIAERVGFLKSGRRRLHHVS